jgi:hypothetical protein
MDRSDSGKNRVDDVGVWCPRHHSPVRGRDTIAATCPQSTGIHRWDWAPVASPASGLRRHMFSCLGSRPDHWVPDTHALGCSACGSAFGIFCGRHHCRCCGGIFCDACSWGRTTLSGWGEASLPVRVCDECHALEVQHLPMLLAGDVWSQRTGSSHRSQRQYLRLAYDQSSLIWSPWQDGEGADSSCEKSAPISQLTCVTESSKKQTATLLLHVGETAQRPLAFEGSAAKVAAWAGALARLIAIVKQRKTYENLYGGNAGSSTFSPRTLAVSSPRVRRLLIERQEQLTDRQQQLLLQRAASGGGERLHVTDDDSVKFTRITPPMSDMTGTAADWPEKKMKASMGPALW